MRILIIVDKQDSAIDILSQKIKEYNPHHDIFVMAVHPKRPSIDQLRLFQKQYQWADIIHWQYWKTAEMLKEKYSWASDKPSVLTHHNPYDIERDIDWNKEYTKVVVKNKYQKEKLPYAKLIPHTVDLDLFEFNEEETKQPAIGMVAGRIESSKGILEVAKIAKNLKVKFILVGRISDRNYYNEVVKEAGKYLDARLDIPESELIKAYHDMWAVIVNSKDNFESGPLIVLEGFATGTPVLTRKVGLVPDIDNGENMIVFDTPDELEENLKFVLKSKKTRDNLRFKGFYTVKNRTSLHSAKDWSRLYYSLNSTPLVSVIIPTFNRADTLPKVIASVMMQSYENLEIVICDDNSTDNTFEVFTKSRQKFPTPIKYVNTKSRGYGLAKARNLGIIEAEGEYLVFLDDRLMMKEGAIKALIDEVEPKIWVWGVKDGVKKDFVENFSAVRRSDIVHGGMFNERIEWYGGMSQEIRERFGAQGFEFKRASKAKAKSFVKSSRWYNKREDLVKAKLFLYKLYV